MNGKILLAIYDWKLIRVCKYKDNNSVCSRESFLLIRVFTIHFVSRNLPALFLWRSRSQFVCPPLDDSDQYRCQHRPLSPAPAVSMSDVWSLGAGDHTHHGQVQGARDHRERGWDWSDTAHAAFLLAESWPLWLKIAQGGAGENLNSRDIVIIAMVKPLMGHEADQWPAPGRGHNSCNVNCGQLWRGHMSHVTEL